MDQLERVLETYLPFIIISSVSHILPDLVITMADFEKGQLAEGGRQPID
jgi:hypothetical protein